MDIMNLAQLAIHVAALAILALGQILTVSPVWLLHYSLTKDVLLLVQTAITNQAQFVIHVTAPAILVLEEQIQTVFPV